VSTRALFLDRDGIINVDKNYVSTPDEFEWMPGIFDLARQTQATGAALIVVTNQSGIARGYYTEETFQSLTTWMLREFTDRDIHLAQVYHCPFLKGPDGKDHPLRKPNPGMLLQAKTDHGLDMSASVMLGDKWTDMAAAHAAGVGHRALIGDTAGEERADAAPAAVDRFPDLPTASDWVIGRLSA